jgi:hypothetical protein
MLNEMQRDGDDCGEYGSVRVIGGWAIAAQDKYTVKVPNRLAFSDFRAYEDSGPQGRSLSA